MDSRWSTNEQVEKAVLDLANGNRPRTSRAYLQCRISEVQMERYHEQEEFDKILRKYFKPGDLWTR